MNSENPPAWEVEVNGLVCITFAATEAKAKWNAVSGYREAYDSRRGVWPSVKAVRRPHLDKSFAFDPSRPRRCFSPEYVA